MVTITGTTQKINLFEVQGARKASKCTIGISNSEGTTKTEKQKSEDVYDKCSVNQKAHQCKHSCVDTINEGVILCDMGAIKTIW